jgi:hypothetical protein
MAQQSSLQGTPTPSPKGLPFIPSDWAEHVREELKAIGDGWEDYQPVGAVMNGNGVH